MEKNKIKSNLYFFTCPKFIEGPVNGHSAFYDYGYRLCSRFWGKGYATEAGKAAFNYCVETMNLKEVYAMADINNTASRNVLEKTGFIFDKTFPYDGSFLWIRGQPITWYEWKAENNAG